MRIGHAPRPRHLHARTALTQRGVLGGPGAALRVCCAGISCTAAACASSRVCPGAPRGSRPQNDPPGACAGIPWDERLWPGAWAAATRVWASPWRPQAAAGLAAARVPRRDLRMAVLVQQLVPARYAFVAHTAHPTTGARPAACSRPAPPHRRMRPTGASGGTAPGAGGRPQCLGVRQSAGAARPGGRLEGTPPLCRPRCTP